jgi:hypothetical protein
LSLTWNVALQQREAIGRDGERFMWTWLYASEFRNGRLVSMTQFELDDEEAAFAYAEERSKESPPAPQRPPRDP